MKIIILLIGIVIISCVGKNSPAKPPLTLVEFETEERSIKGLIEKFVYDNDPERVHSVSIAIESTFAIDCVPVGRECDLYHDLVTEIIQATQDQKFTLEEKIKVLKMKNELEAVFKVSKNKLIEELNKKQ